MQVAFVHDWLDTYRGGERVLEALIRLFPDAPIYTLFYDPSKMPESIRARTVHTPPGINWLKPVRKALLPFLPTLIESFNLFQYDLIISTSSAVAKGAIPSPNAKHVCYLHTPMRYAWDQHPEYLRNLRQIPFFDYLFQCMLSRLRTWDVASCTRVDRFVANSNFVRRRVGRYYGREAEVIFPPIALSRFQPRADKDNFYLAAGALVPYKRYDLAIEACSLLNRRLIIAGSGPELSRLKEIAGSRAEFIVDPSEETMTELLGKARALLFPGVEDFGMVPVEAMASGTPVIAFKKGGALDYVIEGETGMFFEKADAEDLAQTITRFESQRFDTERLTTFAAGFNQDEFLRRFVAVLQDVTGS